MSKAPPREPRRRKRERRLRSYAVALALWAAALVGTLLLSSFLYPAVFLLFYLTVVLASWYGGLGPGLLSAVLSVASCGYFLFPPARALGLHSPSDFLLLVAMLVITAWTSMLTARLRTSRREAEFVAHEAADLNVELEQQIEETQQLLEELELSNEHLDALRVDAERTSDRLRRLYRVISGFSNSNVPAQIASVILEEGQAALGARSGAVALITPDGSALRIIRSTGLPDDFVERWSPVPLESSTPITDAIRTGESVVLDTTEAHIERYPRLRRLWSSLGTGCSVYLPLQIEDRPLGAVAFGLDTAPDFGDDDREFLLALAHPCSQALERARLFMAKRRHAERLRAVVDTAADAIVLLDENGAIESVNPATERMFGYTSRELVGRSVTMLMPELDFAQPDGGPDRVLGDPARKVGTRRETSGRRKDGSAFPIDLALSEVPLHDGRLFTAILRDSTERKENEAQLRTAKEAAEEASLVKSQFLAVMSHELRTPLNAIIGYQDLLDEELAGPLNDTQREHLQRIRDSAWHLLQLINEVLSLSRIEAGKEEIHVDSAALAPLVRDAVALIEPQAHRKGLDLVVREPDEPVQLVSDLGKVRQILLNLLSNALKFTEQGGITVEIALDGDRVLIRVRDTGIGIAPDQLDDIFEPFHQVDQSATRKQGGTGLGLPVSRQLAELMGGELTVESAVGAGSVFTLELPREIPGAPSDG